MPSSFLRSPFFAIQKQLKNQMIKGNSFQLQIKITQAVSNIHLFILKPKVVVVKTKDSQAQYNVELDHQDYQGYSKFEFIKIVFVHGIPFSLVLVVLLLATALLLKLMEGVEHSYQFRNIHK